MFTGSAAMAAGGLGLLAAPTAESGPARNLALLGQITEMLAFERMTRRIGLVAEPFRTGRGGAYIRAGQVLGAAGATGAALSATPAVPAGRVRRILAAASGARPARRVGRHPVRCLPRRDGLGPRPEVHGRTAAGAAGRAHRARPRRLAAAGPRRSCRLPEAGDSFAGAGDSVCRAGTRWCAGACLGLVVRVPGTRCAAWTRCAGACLGLGVRVPGTPGLGGLVSETPRAGVGRGAAGSGRARAGPGNPQPAARRSVTRYGGPDERVRQAEGRRRAVREGSP